MTTTFYTDEARALTQDAKKALGAIATFRDPNLTPEGVSKKKAEASAELRPKLAASAKDIRSRAEARAFVARNTANANRPKLGDQPADLIRSEQKWEQARTLLENGRSIEDVVAGADTDTLLAIEEWAPTYLAAKEHRPAGGAEAIGRAIDGERAPVTVDVSRLVNRRFAEVLPEEFSAALTEAEGAEADFARAAPYLRQADLLAIGQDYPGGDMAVAVDSLYATE